MINWQRKAFKLWMKLRVLARLCVEHPVVDGMPHSKSIELMLCYFLRNFKDFAEIFIVKLSIILLKQSAPNHSLLS